MINADMRFYDYFTFGEPNAYGQQQLSKNPTGKIKMSINLTSQSIQDNINYKNSQFVGLTLDNKIDTSYVIQYNDTQLKVLYVNPKGKYKQVFLNEY